MIRSILGLMCWMPSSERVTRWTVFFETTETNPVWGKGGKT